MTGKRRLVPRWFIDIVVVCGVLSFAGRASATLSFDVIQYGFGNGPTAAAAAPPSAVASFVPTNATIWGTHINTLQGGLPQVAGFNQGVGAGLDTFPDLAVANADGATVSIYLGTGTGFSLNATHTLTGTGTNPLKSPQGIALGDFNGDGKTDIVVSNYSGASVSVFLGDGLGNFSGPTNTVTLKNPLGIAVGRFQGTAQPMGSVQPMDDIVVVELSASTSGKVAILRNNGNATFSRWDTPSAVGSRPKYIAVGDFGSGPQVPARDGIPDVAVTLNGGGAIAILFGDGAGQFQSSKIYTTDAGPKGIAVADFDKDDCPDLATVNHTSGANTVAVLRGICSGGPSDTFVGASNKVILANNANSVGVAAIDLNGDGTADLAVSDTGTDSVALVLNVTSTPAPAPAPLLFQAAVYCAADNGPVGLAAGSFNPTSNAGDDVALCNRSADDASIVTDIVIVAAPPGGYQTVSCPVNPPLQIGMKAAKKPAALAACDVTGASGTGAPDGNTDLLILDQSSPQKVVIFGGDGAGNFARGPDTVAVPGSTGSSIACGLGNSDTFNDFVVANHASDDAQLCVNSGAGTFSCGTLSAPAGALNGPTSIILADLHNDPNIPGTFGTPPLNYAITSESFGTGLDKAFISTDSTRDHLLADAPQSVVADRFGSGFVDLAIAASTGNEVDILFNNQLFGGVNTPGKFSTATPPSTMLLKPLGTVPGGSTKIQPVWIASGPLDNDSLPDLVTADKGQDRVSVLLQIPSGGDFFSPVTYSASNAPDSVAIADFDGDGANDVGVAAFSSDKVAILLGNKDAGGHPTGSLTACPTNTGSCEFTAGDGPLSIQVAKFNGDMKPDIAVVDQNSGALTVLLNTSAPPPTPGPTPTPGGGGGGC
jgi:FG-GAP-like repeat